MAPTVPGGVIPFHHPSVRLTGKTTNCCTLPELKGCLSLGFITLWLGESFVLCPACLGSQNMPWCPHAPIGRHRALGSAFLGYKSYPTSLFTLAQPCPEKPPVCCVCLLLHRLISRACRILTSSLTLLRRFWTGPTFQIYNCLPFPINSHSCGSPSSPLCSVPPTPQL